MVKQGLFQRWGEVLRLIFPLVSQSSKRLPNALGALRGSDLRRVVPRLTVRANRFIKLSLRGCVFRELQQFVKESIRLWETPISQITSRHPRIMGIIILALGLVLQSGRFTIHSTLPGTKRPTLQRVGGASGTRSCLWSSCGAVWDEAKGMNKIDPQNLSVKNILILLTLAGAGLAVFFLFLANSQDKVIS